MRPKSEPKQPQRELFQIDLDQLIDMNHPLVGLGQYIDWDGFTATLGGSYHPTHGAPGISTRLMVALHYLKYHHDLSDEDACASAMASISRTSPWRVDHGRTDVASI